MRDMLVRAAEPRDAVNYAAWLHAAAGINLVDAGVYGYPTTNTLVVEKAGEPVLMNSFHGVLVMEALAPKPGMGPMLEARALRGLFNEIGKVAQYTGVREVMFGCKDPSLEKFIVGRGFEKLDFPMFRARVKEPLQ